MKPRQFVVLVPVKELSRAKSRLGFDGEERARFATAFALDTITAAGEAAAVARVFVVTADPELAERVSELGIETLPEGAGLNDSLRLAASTVRERFPDAVPVALCSDLPCLCARDLDEALGRVTDEQAWFVVDKDGVGTTMYAAAYDAFEPHFGRQSRLAHLEANAREIPGDLECLRLDVDNELDLVSATGLGIGTHSGAALALSTRPLSTRPRPGRDEGESPTG